MATKSGIQAGWWSDLEATRWELSWGKKFGGQFKPEAGAIWRFVQQGAQTGEGALGISWGTGRRSLDLQDKGAVHEPSASTFVPCPLTREGSCPVTPSESAGGLSEGLGEMARQLRASMATAFWPAWLLSISSTRFVCVARGI